MSDRVRRAEVLADVVQLHAEYARLIDVRDAQGWSRLFTEDAALVREAGTATGREELVAFAEQSPVGVHLPGLPSLEPQPDGTVRVTAHFVFVNAGTRTVVAGTYRDELVPGGEGLLFRRREIEARGRLEIDAPPQ